MWLISIFTLLPGQDSHANITLDMWKIWTPNRKYMYWTFETKKKIKMRKKYGETEIKMVVDLNRKEKIRKKALKILPLKSKPFSLLPKASCFRMVSRSRSSATQPFTLLLSRFSRAAPLCRTLPSRTAVLAGSGSDDPSLTWPWGSQ